MIRCCLCRELVRSLPDFEPTDLPGSGWRCKDRYACSQRVRTIIDAHKSLSEACE